MRDFLFGTGAAVMWFAASAAFTFLATYLWLIVIEIGGIRGTTMATIFTGLAITTAGFGLLLSHQAVISNEIVGAIISAVWPPILLASAVLTDVYAADRNGHRAITTRVYLWYQRLKTEDKENDKRYSA